MQRSCSSYVFFRGKNFGRTEDPNPQTSPYVCPQHVSQRDPADDFLSFPLSALWFPWFWPKVCSFCIDGLGQLDGPFKGGFSHTSGHAKEICRDAEAKV